MNKNLKVIPVRIVYSWETGMKYLKVVGHPLDKNEFSKLKKKGLIHGIFGLDASEMEIPQGWYLTEEYEKLEELGFTVSKEIKEFIDKERQHRKKSRFVREVADKASIRCPECGQKLILGKWTDKGATLHCYKHNYTAVIKVEDKKYKVIDKGYDEEKNREYNVEFFWDSILLETLDVEKAKAQIMKKREAIGSCLICGETLKTLKEVLEHLRKVHGCD